MKRKYILVSVALATLLAAFPASAANEAIGVNSAVRGDVTITDVDALARQAQVKDMVRLGEEIISGAQSTLQVLLNDQTVFTVGPNCILTIDKFVYDPSNSNSGMTASIKKGMFRFMSGNISKSSGNAVTIETPVASMGVRGTIVEGVVGSQAIDMARRSGVLPPGAKADADGATIFILRGPGENKRSDNRRGAIDVTSGGKTVTIEQAGMATFILADGIAPSDPFSLPDEVYAIFSQNLRTRREVAVQPQIDLLDVESGFEYFDPLTDLDFPLDEENDPPIEDFCTETPTTSCP